MGEGRVGDARFVDARWGAAVNKCPDCGADVLVTIGDSVVFKCESKVTYGRSTRHNRCRINELEQNRDLLQQRIGQLEAELKQSKAKHAELLTMFLDWCGA